MSEAHPVRQLSVAVAGISLLCLALSGCSSGSRKSAGLTPVPTAGTAVAGTGHASVGNLVLTDAYIPEPAAPDVAAAYLTITNNGSIADTITKLSTSVTNDVQAMSETTSGTAGTMTDLSKVTIPAHASVKLVQGHSHLMLSNPTRHLKTGDEVTLTITFTHAGTVTLTLPVVPVTGPSSSSGGMAGMPGMG